MKRKWKVLACVALLCLAAAYYLATGISRSDKSILRAEFDVPRGARVLSYRAYPDGMASWGPFGREGLEIDPQKEARQRPEETDRKVLRGPPRDVGGLAPHRGRRGARGEVVETERKTGTALPSLDSYLERKPPVVVVEEEPHPERGQRDQEPENQGDKEGPPRRCRPGMGTLDHQAIVPQTPEIDLPVRGSPLRSMNMDSRDRTENRLDRNVYGGTCAVMYLTPGFTYHSIHRWIMKAVRKY